MDDTKRTLIEDGTEFEGTVRSECPIELSGKIKGELSAPNLTVTSSGSVEGKVKVSELRSSGEVAGEIEAGAVELAGQVSDNTVIRAHTLEVKLDQQTSGHQVTFGSCELKVGPESGVKPPKSKIVEEKAAKPVKKPEPAQAQTTPSPKTDTTPDKDKDVADLAMDLMLGKD